jgi:hypothetical protein
VTQYGVGQGFIGGIYQFKTDYLEHAQIGLQLYLPTATEPESERVWPVELGTHNLAVGAHVAVQWNHNRWFNPYIQVDGRVNMPTKTQRRVPRLVSRGEATVGDQKMALGRVEFEALPAGNFVDEQESFVRGFSDFVSDVRWRLGHSLNVQVGTILEHIIDKGGYLDCAYRVSVKLKDEVLDAQPFGKYATQPLVANTNELAHQFLLGYAYHFTDNFRLSVQGSYVFSGKNVPQALGATALLGFSF